jgi:hypothetical protein
VDLRLLEHRDLELPAPDPAFTRQVVGLLAQAPELYSLSVLDLTDPAAPRYAEHAGDTPRNPGSVGKLVAATGLFRMLADAYPDDLGRRGEVLRKTVVTADEFIVSDHHKVRFWDAAAGKLTRRALVLGDQGTLYEYLDWMLSASSNAAAATVMEHAMLLGHLGRDYPPPGAPASFFADAPRQELAALYERTFLSPMTEAGLDVNRFRQGSFFTRTGKKKVPGMTSYATTRELMRFLVRMEQGRIVDEFSSREIKRLIYMTERRIRYASSPALRDAAVYFKSGSLYSCEPEPGFKCRKYHGNKKNLLNSVAIVEAPARERKLFYIVALTSNVLRKNSAVDHQTLGTRIHRVIEKAHQ